MWQQVSFGNGIIKDLNDVRLKVSWYISTLNLHINLISFGSQGCVKSYMNALGGSLREMRRLINSIVATMQASYTEDFILTSYPNHDKAIWKEIG